MDGARARALAAFHQPRRAVAVGAPQATAFPTSVRIVNTAIESLGIEAHRVGNAQHHHLAVLERDKAVIEIGGRNWHVVAEAERVVLIDPGVIARLRAAIGKAVETGPRIFVEGPA